MDIVSRQMPLLVVALIALIALIAPWTAARAQERPYPIVDTGQSRCYGTAGDVRMAACPPAGAPLFGQDAQHVAAPPHYRNNGDGTVSDLVTGLMWQKDFTRDVAWSDAPALAARATTGGHADWRVPTIKELYSLMNFDGATGTLGRGGPSAAPADARPYLDTGVFAFEYPSGRQLRFIDAQYISATAYLGMTMGRDSSFFGVNFADGRIKGYPQRGRMDGAGWYLRLVRGNPSYGRNSWHDNRDGTVTDDATGLTWMRADSGDAAHRPALARTRSGDGRMDWPEALAFCAALDLGGATDWRLPDAKELHSLVDYSRSPQVTRSAAIDPIFSVTAIVDESGGRNYPAYWTSTTHLDGRNPGDHAVVVFFGEALGTPGNVQIGGGPPGGGQGMMSGPPGGGGPGMMGGPPGGGGPGMMGGPPGGGPGMMGGPSGPRGDGRPVDVHGAGAQRSEPKTGAPADYPKMGQGPQGDVVRVYNHVRCVRGG